MNTKKPLIVWILVVLLGIAVTPLIAQQQNPQPTRQNPTEAPYSNDANTQESSPGLSQAPGNSSQNPSAIGDDVTRADSRTSWGIPLVTLLGGLAIGYFIGRSRPAANLTDIRRDRNRVA